MRREFSSESVTEGHPDKFCDLVSDTILDKILEQDPYARVALETVAKGKVTILGEVTTTAKYDPAAIVRQVAKDIGYTTASFGINPDDLIVDADIVSQSLDISLGVGTKDDVGAGDQGMMFGYACNEIRILMPAPIFLAHRLAERLTNIRKDSTLSYLRPDGKTQVTVDYTDPKNLRVTNVVVAAQHDPEVEIGQLREDVKRHVILPVLEEYGFNSDARLFINNTGRFVEGGPMADAGLTGRKIIVDTYGGACGHGGGAFSGKDPTKVDRTASYMLRHIAKNIVAAGLAEKCEIQVAYAIGGRAPVSLHVNTYGTGKVSDDFIYNAVEKLFPLSPGDMINYLDLRRPIFRKTTNYGHFGRPGLPWESTSKVDGLRTFAKL